MNEMKFIVFVDRGNGIKDCIKKTTISQKDAELLLIAPKIMCNDNIWRILDRIIDTQTLVLYVERQPTK